jgi:hypothetical protein
MHVVPVAEADIDELFDKISDACDGYPAVVILVAMSDMLMAITDAQKDLTMNNTIADFMGILQQRHGQNQPQSLN